MAARQRIGRHVQQTGRGFWRKENKIWFLNPKKKLQSYDADAGGGRRVKPLKLKKTGGQWAVSGKAKKKKAPYMQTKFGQNSRWGIRGGSVNILKST